jgi:uncharacterized membrane protein
MARFAYHKAHVCVCVFILAFSFALLLSLSGKFVTCVRLLYSFAVVLSQLSMSANAVDVAAAVIHVGARAAKSVNNMLSLM